MTTSQRGIFDQAALRWEQIVTGDLPNATYGSQTVDDLLIAASSVTIDGPGGVLGQAGPDALRSGSYLPYHGEMEFDSADMASMESNGTLYDVVLHEIGHILGIGTIWRYKGLLVGAGTSNPRFTGPQAVAAYNAIFGTSASAVPVANTGGPGSRDSHWRESVFGNELMSPYIGGSPNPLSRITVGSLIDLGYTANLNAADAYTPPGGGASATSARSARRAALVAAEFGRRQDAGSSGLLRPDRGATTRSGTQLDPFVEAAQHLVSSSTSAFSANASESHEMRLYELTRNGHSRAESLDSVWQQLDLLDLFASELP